MDGVTKRENKVLNKPHGSMHLIHFLFWLCDVHNSSLKILYYFVLGCWPKAMT